MLLKPLQFLSSSEILLWFFNFALICNWNSPKLKEDTLPTKFAHWKPPKLYKTTASQLSNQTYQAYNTFMINLSENHSKDSFLSNLKCKIFDELVGEIVFHSFDILYGLKISTYLDLTKFASWWYSNMNFAVFSINCITENYYFY